MMVGTKFGMLEFLIVIDTAVGRKGSEGPEAFAVHTRYTDILCVP